MEYIRTARFTPKPEINEALEKQAQPRSPQASAPTRS